MSLKTLSLRNFKSVEDLTLPLEPLTVLTGLNGSGKSSVLQAIALIKQSLDADPREHTWRYAALWLHLGRSDDVLLRAKKADTLGLALQTDGGTISWQCDAPSGLDTLNASLTGDITLLEKTFSGFQFIQADRMTPAIQYEQAGSVDRDRGSLGPRGEYTVDYLSRHEDTRVSPIRRYPESRLRSNEDRELMRSIAPTASLDVTTAWLQLLSPGAFAPWQSLWN
ncbi:MAG: AAA family ATPase [Betaproteobacteria bacterium]|nr:AAA family ATPase [Betaproteobacteria bacterium]